MLRHRYIDRIACVILALTLLATCCFVGAGAAGLIETNHSIGYENRLFDQSRAHTIDIVMDNWEAFIADATSETYYPCTLVIDGEKYGNVGIRGKGNTSLSSVASYGNDRYSFKVEFDQYQNGNTYHGLDKLSLNNLIQDTTYLKDYLSYTLMGKMGVAAPLCSFAQINVNGQPWGLYLAVEGVEDSFLARNYGSNSGELYKPDSMSFGGGRGNGRDFDMGDFSEMFGQWSGENSAEDNAGGMFSGMNPFGGMPGGNMPEMPAGGMNVFGGQENGAAMPQMPDFGGNPFGNQQGGDKGFGGFGGMGSSDVKLQYTDDDPDSYSNIFNNAKTDITEKDKARLIASLKVLSDPETAPETVDIESVIRYFVVHNFLCNGDSYTGSMIHNYYLYEEDGILSMIPWDYNLAFGSFGMGGGFGAGMSGATGDVNSPIDSPVSGGDTSSRPMIAWIFANEEYLAQYHDIYAQMMAEIFDSGWFAEEFDRVTALIDPYVQQDTNGFYSYDEFRKGIETMREFCLLRAQSVTGQLNGTIPSTSAGQSAEAAALVDASHLSTSDMGSMGGMGGGKMDRGGMTKSDREKKNTPQNAGTERPSDSMQQPGGVQQPDGMTMPEGMQMPEGIQIPGGMQMPDGMTMPEGMQIPGGMQMPDGMTMPEGMQIPGGMQMPGGMTIPGEVQRELTTDAPAAAEAAAETAESEATALARNDWSAGLERRAASTSNQQNDAWILLGISTAVLLAGLLIAWRYRSGR